MGTFGAGTRSTGSRTRRAGAVRAVSGSGRTVGSRTGSGVTFGSRAGPGRTLGAGTTTGGCAGLTTRTTRPLRTAGSTPVGAESRAGAGPARRAEPLRPARRPGSGHPTGAARTGARCFATRRGVAGTARARTVGARAVRVRAPVACRSGRAAGGRACRCATPGVTLARGAARAGELIAADHDGFAVARGGAAGFGDGVGRGSGRFCAGRGTLGIGRRRVVAHRLTGPGRVARRVLVVDRVGHLVPLAQIRTFN